MTNVALAMLKDPGLPERLKLLVVMGGAAWESGNITAAGEFNIYCDPEAAQIVFQSGAPLFMVGLDVTQRAVLRAEHADMLAQRTDDPSSRLLAAVMTAGFSRGWEELYAHDLLAVAAVVDEALIQWQDLHVEVETESELTRGLTLADRRTRHWRPAPAPNVRVGAAIDHERFVHLFLDTMAGVAPARADSGTGA